MSVATISPRQAPSGIRWAVKPVRPGAGIVRRADGPVPDVEGERAVRRGQPVGLLVLAGRFGARIERIDF